MNRRTVLTVTAVLFVVVAVVFLLTGAPRSELPRMSAEHSAIEEEVASAVESVFEHRNASVQRTSIESEVSQVIGGRVLRVVLERLSEADARTARVTVCVRDEDGRRIGELRESLTCYGTASEFALDSFFALVHERHEGVRVDELDVEIDVPFHLLERARIPLTEGTARGGGEQVVFEARVRPGRPVFWPEFSLSVRDAKTRVHLKNIELRVAPAAWSAVWGANRPDTVLGECLRSPIALLGGHAADEPEVVAGVALRPSGEQPRDLAELVAHMQLQHGVLVSARAPGYAEGSVTVDVTSGKEAVILLKPGTSLRVRLSNVQLERYAELDARATLFVHWVRSDGGDEYVRFLRLDDTVAFGDVRIDGLVPGAYRVGVALRGDAWVEGPVLALEEVSVEALEIGEVALALADTPAPVARATLAGVISFPEFGMVEQVRLKVIDMGGYPWAKPVMELSLAEFEPMGGGRPSYSFRIDDLAIGGYHLKLVPFLESWVVDLPVEGRDDMDLTITELAEVVVETVDARTGEPVAATDLKFGHRNRPPRFVRPQIGWADCEEPGHFRFWTTPGGAFVRTNRLPREYGWCEAEFELVAGLQTVRLEIGPAYYIHFEFRIEGVPAKPPEAFDAWVRYEANRRMRALGHSGRVLGRVSNGTVEATGPGLYEIRLDGLGGERFLPIPPQRVDVREGEVAEVVVELRRR